MANIKSQKKRVLISREENARNNSLRSEVKTAIKKYEAAIAANDIAKAEELLPVTFSVIDAARSDGLFHINNVARKKARLAKMLDNAKKAQ
ncbi:MAG: 30S ribosomal protein S20 [Clostridiales bacterium]|jgi:small subunit ribosomal protein S20|nr:30S ribosomal protein S20 [Clostridiales bacterium]MDY4655891.1 30S ribosomal protein S20 [Eubacteriales bacterium]